MADVALPTDLNLGASAMGGKQTVGMDLAATAVDGNAMGVNASSQAAKGDADGTVSNGLGLLVNGGAAGARKAVVTGGKVSGLADLTPGAWYYLSETAGRICPIADLKPSTPRVALLYAISATDGMVIPSAPVTRELVPLQVQISDDTAGVTSTKFASVTLPKKATLVAVEATALTVGAAGATIDIKILTASILDAVIDAETGGAAVAGVLATTAADEDDVLLFYYTTGASTGSLVGCTVTVWVQLAE